MVDLLWPILAVLGLLLAGVGGGGWLASRLRKKKTPEPEPRAPRPAVDRPRIAPTEPETQEANRAADETDEKLRELEARADEVDSVAPDPVAPDPVVVNWLRTRRDD